MRERPKGEKTGKENGKMLKRKEGRVDGSWEEQKR